MKEVPPDLPVKEVDFSTTTFWVRMFGLPKDFISLENGKIIAGRIGRLLEMDKCMLNIFFSGDYVRIRIEVVVTKPF